MALLALINACTAYAGWYNVAYQRRKIWPLAGPMGREPLLNPFAAPPPVPTGGTFHRRRRDWAILAAVLAFGFGLRIYHLGTASLWYDELFSRFYPELGLRFMWTQGLRAETNPPLYSSLLLAWMHIFGTSETALRLPTVLASILTIPLINLLGRELAGRSCGLIAALIFAAAPMEVYYAQEARTYALMLCPVTLMLLGLAYFARLPRWPGALVCYGTGAVLVFYMHATSVFIVAAGGFTGLAIALTMDGKDRWNMVIRWVAVNVVVAALCIPQLLALLTQVRTNSFSWMQPTTFWDVRASVATMISGPASYPSALQQRLTIMLGVAILAAFIDFRPSLRATLVLIGLPLIYLLLLLVATIFQPLLLPRILCWIWIPLSVLLAYGIVQSRTRILLIGATGLLLAVGLGFQLAQDGTAKEPWRQFIARLDPTLSRANLVVTGPSTMPTALFYYEADHLRPKYWTETFSRNPVTDAIRDMLGFSEIDRNDLHAAIRAGGTVVLIQRVIDAQFLPLLDVPPPARILTQQCWGTGPCLSALIWGPASEP